MVCDCLSLQEVDLTHARLKKVPEILGTLTRVEILSLRQNLIKDVSLLSELATLQELDLYDNELASIHGLEKLTSLT